MKNEKHLIWTNDFCHYDENRDEYREMYEEFHEEIPSEEELTKCIYDQIELDMDTEKGNIEFQEGISGVKTYIVRARIQRWDGTYSGGKVIKGLWNAISATFEDYNEVYQEGRRLKVDAVHHDGRNCFEIRELNKNGQIFFEKNESWMDDRKLHEKLWNPRYSREVQLFNELYGWYKPTRKIS
jgi:hypothetical protein